MNAYSERPNVYVGYHSNEMVLVGQPYPGAYEYLVAWNTKEGHWEFLMVDGRRTVMHETIITASKPATQRELEIFNKLFCNGDPSARVRIAEDSDFVLSPEY